MSTGSDVILNRMMTLHPKVIDLTLDRVHRLLAALAQPFNHHSPIPAEFTEPAPATEAPYQTYCGT